MVKVPCSASNLSSKGVKAKTFIKAWKKPAWTRGKVFVRYTRQHNRISNTSPEKMHRAAKEDY